MRDEPFVDVPAIAVSVDHQISDGRVIRFQTGIAQDAKPAELNVLLDKLTAATDRQAAKYRLEMLQHKLAEEEKLYTVRQEDLLRLDEEAKATYEASNRKAPWSLDKLSPPKLSERTNATIFIQRTRDHIVAMRDEIALLSKQVAAHVPDGGTNCS